LTERIQRRAHAILQSLRQAAKDPVPFLLSALAILLVETVIHPYPRYSRHDYLRCLQDGKVNEDKGQMFVRYRPNRPLNSDMQQFTSTQICKKHVRHVTKNQAAHFIAGSQPNRRSNSASGGP